MPKTSLKSIFIAADVGLIFPVCECAIVPVVKRLFQKGLPLDTGISFLSGGTIVDPLVVLSTAVAYGYDWPMAIRRVLIGYLVAVTMGFLVALFFDKHGCQFLESWVMSYFVSDLKDLTRFLLNNATLITLIVILDALAWMLITGNYTSFLHPRFWPFLLAAAAIIVLNICAIIIGQRMKFNASANRKM